jgi:hypothetical protein
MILSSHSPGRPAAEPSASLGRVVGQQLARDNVVHRNVQPGAERLTVSDHLFIAAQRVFESCVLSLDQECELVLVRGIQQVGWWRRPRTGGRPRLRGLTAPIVPASRRRVTR